MQKATESYTLNGTRLIENENPSSATLRGKCNVSIKIFHFRLQENNYFPSDETQGVYLEGGNLWSHCQVTYLLRNAKIHCFGN